MGEYHEPWKVGSVEGRENPWATIEGEGGSQVLDNQGGIPLKTAERIVACVNACSGIPSDELVEKEGG